MHKHLSIDKITLNKHNRYFSYFQTFIEYKYNYINFILRSNRIKIVDCKEIHNFKSRNLEKPSQYAVSSNSCTSNLEGSMCTVTRVC